MAESLISGGDNQTQPHKKNLMARIAPLRAQAAATFSEVPLPPAPPLPQGSVTIRLNQQHLSPRQIIS